MSSIIFLRMNRAEGFDLPAKQKLLLIKDGICYNKKQVYAVCCGSENAAEDKGLFGGDRYDKDSIGRG